MINAIGCDIVSIKRIQNVLNNFPDILNRAFSEKERDEYHNRNNSIHYLASRFAAKEAIVKALKEYNNDLNTIEILNKEITKEPYIIVNGAIKENILISLSYETDYVIAYAVLLSIHI